MLYCRSTQAQVGKKKSLRWGDLDGETIMMVKRGESPVINKIRDEIEEKHTKLTIADTPHFYDTSVFNECEQSVCVMKTLDIWKDVHPSLVTIPMEWDYIILQWHLYIYPVLSACCDSQAAH